VLFFELFVNSRDWPPCNVIYVVRFTLLLRIGAGICKYQMTRGLRCHFYDCLFGQWLTTHPVVQATMSRGGSYLHYSDCTAKAQLHIDHPQFRAGGGIGS
jgi:hypothetical protein